EHLLVVDRLANAHVERDLADARHLHHGLVAVALHQLGDDLLAVEGREARGRRGDLRAGFLGNGRSFDLLAFLLRRLLRLLLGTLLLGVLLRVLVLVFLVLGHGFPYASTCSPFDRNTRTLRPSASVLNPTRSAFCVAGL